jgi:hypothetical protein
MPRTPVPGREIDDHVTRADDLGERPRVSRDPDPVAKVAPVLVDYARHAPSPASRAAGSQGPDAGHSSGPQNDAPLEFHPGMRAERLRRAGDTEHQPGVRAIAEEEDGARLLEAGEPEREPPRGDLDETCRHRR